MEKIVKNASYWIKNVASIQILKVTIFDTDRKKINLIPYKSFRYYTTHSYKVNTS